MCEGENMKILLLGEFSSLHKYLKEGLKSIGYDVVLVSSGDGWKKIGEGDYPLYFNRSNINNKLIEPLYLYKEAKYIIEKLGDFDVIQLINPRIYHPFINAKLIKKIMKKGTLISLLCCGNDLALNRAYKNNLFEYYMMDGDNSLANEYNPLRPRGLVTRLTEGSIIDKCDVIIPTAYEYSIGYKNNIKLSKVVPMPINVDSIQYKENFVSDKIVIFHGVSREGVKGTAYIRAALEKVKNVYSDKVEVIIDGHMPFEQYTKIMQKANIVIDQCLSYAYGINADIAMAQGKIVMSGARIETLNALEVENCPIFSIKPDVNQIYNTIEYIIKNKDKIPKWGMESRKYVERIHDCKKVARKFVEVWGIKDNDK